MYSPPTTQALTARAGLEASTIALFEPTAGNYGCGAECLSVAEALLLGSPAKSLGWIGHLTNSLFSSIAKDIRTPTFMAMRRWRVYWCESYPGASGNSMQEIVTAQFDHTRLDQPTNKTRLRLNNSSKRSRRWRIGQRHLRDHG